MGEKLDVLKTLNCSYVYLKSWLEMSYCSPINMIGSEISELGYKVWLMCKMWKLCLWTMVPKELKYVKEEWNAMIDISESYTYGQWYQWNEMMWERLWNKPWFNYSELTSKIELPKSL